MTVFMFQPSRTLTFETVQTDNRRFLNLLKENHQMTGIRFNLSEVMHCDSTGLALLIEAKRLCKQAGLTFVLENMSESIHALAEFCGVDTILVTTYPSSLVGSG